MQFLRKTEEPGKFMFKSGDTGLVSVDEIVKELDNPQDNLTSSSRCGKVTFDQEQLGAYKGTLRQITEVITVN